ncbi:hypothetical protein MKW94_024723 [Papaver nudicaule]|uniref:Uncharacterized protein n=1 Tax=Papaver nudicaule TaxID=74823 RepID=A0AA41V080_PAPNU|nr:hypothetical protein [Papaver nudicaule]
MDSGKLAEKEKRPKNGKTSRRRNSAAFDNSAVVEDSAAEDSRYIYPKYLRKACCKINNYSSLITLGDVWSVMSKTEEAQFRETAIGYLMDMPAKQKWSAAVFCFLMSRRINVEPERKSGLIFKNQIENCVSERKTLL